MTTKSTNTHLACVLIINHRSKALCQPIVVVVKAQVVVALAHVPPENNDKSRCKRHRLLHARGSSSPPPQGFFAYHNDDFVLKVDVLEKLREPFNLSVHSSSIVHAGVSARQSTGPHAHPPCHCSNLFEAANVGKVASMQQHISFWYVLLSARLATTSHTHNLNT